jgi:glutaconate CoA-transferase subunit B
MMPQRGRAGKRPCALSAGARPTPPPTARERAALASVDPEGQFEADAAIAVR